MAAERRCLRPIARSMDRALHPYRRVLAVVAHPDDESFGLGALLTAFADGGAETSVLCFTHGEASTLHTGDTDLRRVRAWEFEQAAATLGVGRSRLLEYRDGGLGEAPLDELAAHVAGFAQETAAEVLLVFDDNGVTGHPDHRRATAAALLAARSAGADVLAWALPGGVAVALNAEFGARFGGRSEEELAVHVRVDRQCQLRAIARHASQSNDNPVLWRRLELLGDSEWMRILHVAAGHGRRRR